MEEITGALWIVMVLLELAASEIRVVTEDDPAGIDTDTGVLLELVVMVMLAPCEG